MSRSQYVNNQTLADVTFVVEGRKFYAHRIALLASSDAFRAMFNGGYREKEASSIEIPNIPWDVFECMMHYIYTGVIGRELGQSRGIMHAFTLKGQARGHAGNQRHQWWGWATGNGVKP